MTPLLHQHPARIWKRLRTGFYADDLAERWSARAAWLLMTACVWLVLVFTVVWGAEVAGVTMGTAGELTVLLGIAVPVISICAITATPIGRTRHPVLVATVLITGAIVAILTG
ncbi:hypothetical protein [Kitasatospora sp. LaBMicrA B282]|uniref:hypothetical protein n=1 Tax=Kitasatospora sp. LaBMicrA B282 TaxID=3420949 RepID=UPI003D0D9BF9